jgi:hypothetical protein
MSGRGPEPRKDERSRGTGPFALPGPVARQHSGSPVSASRGNTKNSNNARSVPTHRRPNRRYSTTNRDIQG